MNSNKILAELSSNIDCFTCPLYPSVVDPADGCLVGVCPLSLCPFDIVCYSDAATQ